jgi:hypothetical protein
MSPKYGRVVDESPAQRRFRRDTHVLAEIGGCLSSQLEPMVVRLPRRLATEALAAWERTEEDPVGPESPEQTIVRAFAATLAFIGLAVEQTGIAGEDEVSVSLTPQQVAGSVFAAELVADRHLDDRDPEAT